MPIRGESQQRTQASDRPPVDLLPKRGLFAGRQVRSHLDGRRFARLRLLVDLVALWLAVAAGLAGPWSRGQPAAAQGALLAFPAVSIGLLYFRGLYRERLRPLALDELLAVISTMWLAAMSIVALMLVGGWHLELTSLVARTWILALGLVALGRVSLVLLQRRLRLTRRARRPTLVVGSGLVGAHIARRLRETPEYGLDPVGFLDADPILTLGLGDHLTSVLGAPDELEEIAAAHAVEHVIIGFTRDADRNLLPLVRRCQSLGIEVSLVPRLFDVHNERLSIEHIGGLPLIRLRGTDPKGWRFAAKHLVDRVGAALALLVASPLMLGIALAIKATSPGPVVFRQRRVGRDGRMFDLLKFRSMRVAKAEEPFLPRYGTAPGGVEGEDRRTAIGRLLRQSSLDELPQLVNVLKGDMSLIGPRPERPEFVALFERDIDRYGERHRVKSGITGWAQVHGLRGQTSVADRVEWDNYYIENWSLRLDMRIALSTVKTLLSWRNEEGDLHA